MSVTLFSSFNTQWQWIFLFNFFALFLGSWWALQEGTWGGWWNWDPSETLGLLVIMSIFFLLHGNFTIANLWWWLTKKQFLLTLLLMAYFFIQLNFEIISHNFNFKLFRFFNNDLLFLELFLIFLLLFSKKWCAVLHCWVTFYTTVPITLPAVKTIGFRVLSLLLTSLFINILVLSFLPIVNYFSWNFFALPISYKIADVKFFIFLISLYLYFFFARLPFLNWFLTLFLVTTYSNFLFFVFFLPYQKIRQIHFSLVLLFGVNLFSLYFDFLSWTYNPVIDLLLTNSNFLYEQSHHWTIAEGVIDRTTANSDEQGFYTLCWTISGLTNIWEVNSFNLFFSHSTLCNFYSVIFEYFPSYILIELHNIINLNLITICFIFLFVINWFSQHLFSQKLTLN